MNKTVKINDDPKWDLYYIIDLRSSEVLNRCYSKEDLEGWMIEHYESLDTARYQNLEVVKAISVEVK